MPATIALLLACLPLLAAGPAQAVAAGAPPVPAVAVPAPGAAAGSPARPLGEVIAEAIEIRTRDRDRFLALLEDLRRRAADATPAQAEQLRYIEAFHRLVYLNDAVRAQREAALLAEHALSIDLRYRAAALAASAAGIADDWSDGLRHVNTLVALRHRVQDPVVRNEGLNTAAGIYNRVAQPQVAMGFAEEVLADNPAPRQRCAAAHLANEARLQLGLLQPGETGSARAVALCEAAGEPIFASFARVVQARSLAAHGRGPEARALLEAIVDDVDRIGYAFLVVEVQGALAELAHAAGDHADAIRHANAVLALADRLHKAKTPAIAHRVLYETALAAGDTATALDHYRRLAAAEHRALDEAEAREMAYQRVRQEIQQTSRQLDVATRENEVLQLRQRVQAQSAQNDRLLMLLLGLLLLTGVAWAWRARRTHAALRRLAETDMLTGISSRRHFTASAGRLLEQSARTDEDAALVMFDLDHFKLVNDRFGHEAGDWVLRRVAEACRAECGPADLFGRIGGEEFAILLPGATTRDARRVAEGCRLRLAGIDTGETGHRFRVTASFGASGSALSGHELSRLVAHADKMLYRAKREGRNRVVAYEMPDPLLPAWDAAPAPDAAPAAAAIPAPAAERRRATH